MAVVRKTVRTALQALLKAAVLPSTSTLCFKSVYEGVPNEVTNDEMPTCLIHIGSDTETRLTDPVGAGTKALGFDVELEIFAWLDPADDLLGERLLDDILDGVALVGRANTTISGSVALWYDSVRTTVHKPVVSATPEGSPGMVLLHATRKVTAHAFDVG